jgi:hypothetical protein
VAIPYACIQCSLQICPPGPPNEWVTPKGWQYIGTHYVCEKCVMSKPSYIQISALLWRCAETFQAEERLRDPEGFGSDTSSPRARLLTATRDMLKRCEMEAQLERDENSGI